ncbi:MAG: DUF3995 domain-containing protein [Rhizobiaceae bacterium]|nr:DUF3995 domain-containing protein [Rhizobiaceae bacterium]
MIGVGLIVAGVLTVLAGIHVYWAAGGTWPGTDEASCARAIAGFRGIDRMPPPAASLAVAALLLIAALLALFLASGTNALPAGLMLLAGTGASFVFVARGIAGYLPVWRRLTPEMPFARNDTRYFSPLCLALGAGFAFLTASGMIS